MLSSGGTDAASIQAAAQKEVVKVQSSLKK